MRAFFKAALLCLQITPTGHTRYTIVGRASGMGRCRVEGRPGTVTEMKWKLFKDLA